ncbi:Membrane-fusion protein [Candidatus Burkholderia humilis]|nr:Membrane-fusion protein [Candidatus Burkholderia humilis]
MVTRTAVAWAFASHVPWRDGVAVLFSDVPPFTMHRYPMETVGVSMFGRDARIHNGVFRMGETFGVMLLPFYLGFENHVRLFDAIPLTDHDAPQRVADCIEIAMLDNFQHWTCAGLDVCRASRHVRVRARQIAPGFFLRYRSSASHRPSFDAVSKPHSLFSCNQPLCLSSRTCPGAGSSVFAVLAVTFGFTHEIELKQNVPCEIVSPSEVKIRGLKGLVSSIYVKPQDKVVPGTPLFQLQRDLSLAIDGLQRQVFDQKMHDDQIRAVDEQYAERRIQLNTQLQSARVTQTSRRAELTALDEQIGQNRQLVDGYKQRMSRLNSVADYVTADKVEQARADVHQGKVTVAQSVARRQQLEGDLASSQSAQADLEAQLRELDARHARGVQDIQVRFEQARQDSTVSSPKAGVVTFSSLVAGRMLTASDVAVVIATNDSGPLRVALSIPSRRRGFVREGQIVRLKFDAFPYAKFGTYEAHIDSISPTTVLPSSPPTEPADSGGLFGSSGSPDTTEGAKDSDGDYLAWATLRGKTFDFEGQHFAILPGMCATASIVVERRTIAEWVLAPLFRMMRG